jgi:hypothetical protein
MPGLIIFLILLFVLWKFKVQVIRVLLGLSLLFGALFLAIWLLFKHTLITITVVGGVFVLLIFIALIVDVAQRRKITRQCAIFVDAGDIESFSSIFLSYNDDQKKQFLSLFSNKLRKNYINNDISILDFLYLKHFFVFSDKCRAPQGPVVFDEDVCNTSLGVVWRKYNKDVNIAINHSWPKSEFIISRQKLLGNDKNIFNLIFVKKKNEELPFIINLDD